MLFALGGLLSAAVASPVPETSVVEIRGGSTNIVDIWAKVDAHIANICMPYHGRCLSDFGSRQKKTTVQPRHALT